VAKVDVKDCSKEVMSAYEQARERSLEIIGLTAEKYAKGECRVDTGRLRNSITHALSGESTSFSYTDDNGKSYNGGISAPDDGDSAVYVGTNVEYAPHVEYGTIKQKAQPFLRPAATEHSQTYKQIITDEFAKIK
jgi:HK97 gp10 family phage protein